MTETNTHIWDLLKKVPEAHLKPFQRGGGFRGTAIKPMWSIHRMTEVFGPCGTGWGIDAPEYKIQLVANDEILVYCIVTVWYEKPSQKLVGVGGDKIYAKFKDGFKSDDEAFKKAFTDAVTNALKHLGVGGDIHMGLFDGSKYASTNGHEEPRASTDQFIYERLVNTMRSTSTLSALTDWKARNKADMEALSDEWFTRLQQMYQEHKATLPAPKKLSERAMEADKPPPLDDAVPF